MENNFTHTKIKTIWLIADLIVGLFVSWQFDTGYEKVGALGLGTIFLGGVIGSFRTGRFFTWSGPVEPNQFEGIIGWSGAALMVAAIVGFTLRVALGKF